MARMQLRVGDLAALEQRQLAGLVDKRDVGERRLLKPARERAAIDRPQDALGRTAQHTFEAAGRKDGPSRLPRSQRGEQWVEHIALVRLPATVAKRFRF